ncbi:MAG: dephospho-CoA kinase [Clostridiales bacterium]|nr:dephospho-CoA kinase [Clostridiales bacterium]
MFVLGITGGIGSGKSTVSGILADKGLMVLDADEISRSVTGPGGRAMPEIASVFGNKVVTSNGALNRRVMSDIAFGDKKKLDDLSTIIHKHVFEQIDEALAKEKEKGSKCVVLDVPIPVNKFRELCDQIWVVTCDKDVRLARLQKRGMDKDEAERRIAVQMTDDEYCELGDHSIDNSWDIEDLKDKVEVLIREQLHERGIRI